MTIQTSPAPVVPQDISLTLTGSPQQLCAANQYRTHLQFQAPSGSSLVYSYTNASCASGLTGCYTLSAGATYAQATSVVTSAVYVNGTNGQLLVATVG